MNLLLVLVTGVCIGILPGIFIREKRFGFGSLVAGIVGALTGAFLGFGDTPLLRASPYLNEITLMVVMSSLFVIVNVFAGKSD